MSTVTESRTVGLEVSREQLLGLGAVLLVVGWAGTSVLAGTDGVGPLGPTAAVVLLWAGLFGAVAAVAVTACPRAVTFSRPVLAWVGLNTVGFAVTLVAAAGLLPPSVTAYAYWHLWVGLAVVGFLLTGVLVHRAGGPGVTYLVAAATEAWVLTLGVLSFQTLVPWQYLLLAVVHATPLALDALDTGVDRWYQTVAQVGVYTVTIVAVLLA